VGASVATRPGTRARRPLPPPFGGVTLGPAEPAGPVRTMRMTSKKEVFDL
jgi:hypothetical protein